MFGFGRKKETVIEETEKTFEQTFTFLVNNVRDAKQRVKLVEVLDFWRPLRTQLQRYTTLEPEEKGELIAKIEDFVHFIKLLSEDIRWSTNAIVAVEYAKKSADNIQRNLTSTRP